MNGGFKLLLFVFFFLFGFLIYRLQGEWPKLCLGVSRRSADLPAEALRSETSGSKTSAQAGGGVAQPRMKNPPVSLPCRQAGVLGDSSIFPVRALAKDYSFPEVKFRVLINQDGSFQVEERRTYDFEGSFSWAEMWIPMKNFQFSISNFQIKDENGVYLENNSQQPGTFYTQTDKDKFYPAPCNRCGIYAKWFYKASNQRKTFAIKYEVHNGINLHQDIAEFYWKLIGDQWQKGVAKVSGEMILPGEVSDDKIFCFGHGPLNGRVEITGKNLCSFSVQNLPKNQFLEVRFLFDKNLIDNPQLTISNQQLSDILAEEKEFAAQTERQKKC